MRLVYLIAFVSGFAALVYQVLWTRQLTLVLGTTTASISTVVAAFMAGLALGSALVGRWVDRWRRRLHVYAVLEAGIAVSAAAILVAIPKLETLYPQVVLAASAQATVFAAVRFLCCFGLLLIPTILMGATFPVLVKALARDPRRFGGTVGRVYAANTLGAVAGCFCAGIYLLGAIGLTHTTYVAIVLNVLLALGAWRLGRAHLGRTAATSQARPSVEELGALPIGEPSRVTRRAICVAAGVTGCIALGYEIVWARALSLVLGHSIYAFTFVLSTNQSTRCRRRSRSHEAT